MARPGTRHAIVGGQPSGIWWKIIGNSSKIVWHMTACYVVALRASVLANDNLIYNQTPYAIVE